MLRRDALLFGESQSRVLLSVKPEMADQVLNRARDSGVPAVQIGTVGGDRFVIDVEKGQRTEGCRIDSRSINFTAGGPMRLAEANEA